MAATIWESGKEATHGMILTDMSEEVARWPLREVLLYVVHGRGYVSHGMRCLTKRLGGLHVGRHVEVASAVRHGSHGWRSHTA